VTLGTLRRVKVGRIGGEGISSIIRAENLNPNARTPQG
jgi:hypothetical protein